MRPPASFLRGVRRPEPRGIESRAARGVELLLLTDLVRDPESLEQGELEVDKRPELGRVNDVEPGKTEIRVGSSSERQMVSMI